MTPEDLLADVAARCANAEAKLAIAKKALEFMIGMYHANSRNCANTCVGCAGEKALRAIEGVG